MILQGTVSRKGKNIHHISCCLEPKQWTANRMFFSFCLRRRFPSLSRDFTVYTVTLPVLIIFQCERCRIRTRDHCFSSLDHNQWDTTFPHIFLIIWQKPVYWFAGFCSTPDTILVCVTEHQHTALYVSLLHLFSVSVPPTNGLSLRQKKLSGYSPIALAWHVIICKKCHETLSLAFNNI